MRSALIVDGADCERAAPPTIIANPRAAGHVHSFIASSLLKPQRVERFEVLLLALAADDGVHSAARPASAGDRWRGARSPTPARRSSAASSAELLLRTGAHRLPAARARSAAPAHLSGPPQGIAVRSRHP